MVLWLWKWRDNSKRNDMFGQHSIRVFHYLGSRIWGEKGLPNQNLLSLPKSNHLKLRLKPLWGSKVNLTLNLNILVMLNVLGVKSMDITLPSQPGHIRSTTTWFKFLFFNKKKTLVAFKFFFTFKKTLVTLVWSLLF
jgi:hypothetical protein